MSKYERNSPGSLIDQPEKMLRYAKADCQIIGALTVVDVFAWLSIFSSSRFLIVAGVSMHLAVIACLLVLMFRSAGMGRDLKYFGMSLILGLTAGPFGMLTSTFIASSVMLMPKSREILDEWYERLTAATTTDDATLLCNSIDHGREISLDGGRAESFMLLMSVGSFSQKQAILEVVAQKYRPELLPVLNLALNAPEAAIRVQAAAVKGKLHKAVLKNLHDAIKDLDQSQSLERVAAAGRKLSQSVASGLLETDQKILALKGSRKIYEVEASIDYNDVDGRALFSGLLPMLGYFDEASMSLKNLAALGSKEKAEQHQKQLEEAFESYKTGFTDWDTTTATAADTQDHARAFS
ncbi:MAG: hypothetical protein ACR2OX_09700 [Methyloligellaceae bacterium]